MSASEAVVLTRVPISYHGADGDETHAPLIVASVGGVETRLVLDTGSDVHLLTKELVDQLGLAVEPGEEGTDHSGATIPSWNVEDVTLSVGEVALSLRDVVAIPAPRPFQGRGIGGILSPQLLHPSARVVIDLFGNELSLVSGDDSAVLALLTERSSGLTTLTLERDTAFPTLVVRAAIEPHPEIPTLLNTGGRNTEFSSDALSGAVVADLERLGAGVGDADVMGARAGEATLVVAGHRIPVESLAIRASMHDPQGMVGMDVLRGTILSAVADVGRPVLWRV